MDKTLNVIDKIVGVLCIIAIVNRVLQGYSFGKYIIIDVIISILFLLGYVIMAWRLLISREKANGWDAVGVVLAIILSLLTIGSAIAFKNILAAIPILLYVYAIIRLSGKNSSGIYMFSGCFLGLSILIRWMVWMVVTILLTRLLCNINPEKTYHWWNGIWHGLFFPSNLVLHWFRNDILFKAPLHSGGYNFFFWFSAISTILCTLGGGRRGQNE